MKNAAFSLTLLISAGLLAAGCGKKGSSSNKDAESKSPTASRSSTSGGPGLRELPEGGAADAGLPKAGAADPALADIPAELLASDEAYEAWFRKHQLNLQDPKMLDGDAD